MLSAIIVLLEIAFSHFGECNLISTVLYLEAKMSILVHLQIFRLNFQMLYETNYVYSLVAAIIKPCAQINLYIFI